MNGVFLGFLNAGIAASWLILAAVLIRLLLRRAPRWISCALWALVGVRLICPVSPESVLSLIPSAQTVPQDIGVAAMPAIDSGISVIDSAVNPVLQKSLAPAVGASANPVQVVGSVLAAVWLAGAALMLSYAAWSYLRLKKQVRTAVPLQGNVYACDEVQSPFILGIFRPKIYVPSAIKGETLTCVVAHETAHIRLEISAQDNLFKMAYRDFEDPCLYVTDLYDAERGAFIHDQALEGKAEGKSCSFSYGRLAYEETLGEDPDGIRFFLIREEQCLEEVIAFLAENGEKVSSWEYTETEQPAKSARMAYTVHVVDQEGEPVEEAAVNFCTDASCVPRESDQNGLITFNGMPAVYHIQLVDVPEGYSYDEDFEFYTDSVYGEWVLRIRKD